MTATALILSLAHGLTTPTAGAAEAAQTPNQRAAVIASAKTVGEATAAAKRQKSRVEILSERTAYSSTFALPSGERETEFGAPFRVQRAGQWYPFDASLVATNGDVSLPVVSVGEDLPRVNQRTAAAGGATSRLKAAAVGRLTLGQPADAKLSKALRDEQRARQRAGSRFGDARVFSPRVSEVPIRIARGGAASDETTPLGEIETTQGASLAVYWPEDLPRAEVDGPRASYQLSGGQELQVTAVDKGFNAHVVLAQRPDPAGGPPVYRFALAVDGVRLVRTQDGGFAALNDQGRALFRIAPTVAWDSSPPTEENPDGPTTVPVESELVTDEQGRTVLEVRPSAEWLAQAQCPCTIDPNFTYTGAPLKDTLIREAAPTTSYGTAATVHTGTKDATTNRQRAYIAFYTPILIGRKINSASLQLRNTNSNTCTATGVSLFPASSYWDESTTWNTRPGHYTTTTYQTSKSFNRGFSTSCPAAYESFNVTNTVTAWINGTLSDYGFAVVAANETATSGFKVFCSFNTTTTGCNQAAWAPKLTVIYNTVPALVQNTSMSPAAACSTATTNQPWVDTTTPVLKGSANDLDEEPTRINFEVWPVTGTPATVVGSSPQYLPPGSLHEWSVPAGNLADGRSYKWRAYGFDGADPSAMASDWCNFRVDVTAPTAPTLASTDYPAGQWSNGAGTAGTFTVTPGTDPVPSGGAASGTSGIVWSLDDPTPSTTVTLNGSGGIDPITVTPKTDGKHTLYVATVDAARNVSPITAHEFFVGHGALTSPDEGERTARRFSLAAQVQDALTVTFQYRRGETDTWHDIPVGTSIAVVGGLTAPVEWDAASTVGGDRKLDMRVKFIGGTSDGLSSAPTSVTIDSLASRAAVTSFGPGNLNLLTGDYSISATDVSFFGVSISRTAKSRAPTIGEDVDAVLDPFGPQWVAGGIASFTGSDFTSLTQTGATTLQVSRADSTPVQFTLTHGTLGGDPVWQPEVGAEELTLAGDSTGFTLESSDGTVVEFAPTLTSGLFTIASATPPGFGNSTRYYFGADGTGKLRLERVIAPNASLDLDNCNVAGAPPVGCRRLDLTYASTTTAAPSVFGDYAGRASTVNLRVTIPGTSTVTDTPVARYSYDDVGRLREVWDPRVSPSLKVTYTYDSDGRVASLTPPGELGYTFAYGATGSDTNAGRLFSVTRGALDDGEAATVSNVVYDVPLTTSGTASANGPHDMDSGTVASWGQTVAPVDATAVFPPDAGFTGNHYGGRSASAWTRATITYLDIDGRQTNQAIPGGGISSIGYDEFGNATRELSLNNRARALRAATDPELISLGLADLTTAQRADLLAETSSYNGTGQRLLQQYGPVRQVILPDSGGSPGGPALARGHTVNTFDQGRPTDGSATVADQVTESKAGARVMGADSDVDVRAIRIYYDWALGQPITVVRDEGGASITSVAAYDDQARPIRADMPSAFAAGRTNGADSTETTYYAAGAAAPCDSVVFDGMVCQTKPGGAISGGGANPSQRVTTKATYTELGLVDQLTETANSATRTTDADYDAAGRVILTTVTGGVGTSVPTVATTYSDTTGRALTTSDTSVSPNPTITRTYDTLGRLTSYIDADGGKTETTYTWLDQVKTTRQFSNPASPTVPVITTYSYSSDRQLLTSMTDPLAGTFTATYDPAGQLVSQAMPGGVSMTQAEDPTGSWLRRTYTGNGIPLSGVLMTEAIAENVHGQWRTRVRGDNLSFGTSQRHDYDKIGRLTQTLDTTGTSTGQDCVRRDYGFTGSAGLNTNRTSYAQTSASGSCPATAGTAVTSTYDTADRIVNAGYVYDAHGRTTTAPLPAGTASIEYHVNDMVRRQTIGNNRKTWWVEPGMRVRSWTTETKPAATWNLTASKVNHYAGDDDSPAWINETASSVIRNVPGIDGELTAYTDAATANVFWLQLNTLHGDVGQVIHYTSATTSDTAASVDTDEYGKQKPGSAGYAYGRYAWLGAKQRSFETVDNSLALMGVRLYNPASGRFLTTDAVPGGNDNAYAYPADPVNLFDLSGLYEMRYPTVRGSGGTLSAQATCRGNARVHGTVCAFYWGVRLYSPYWNSEVTWKAVVKINGAKQGGCCSKQNVPGNYIFHSSIGGRDRPNGGPYTGSFGSYDIHVARRPDRTGWLRPGDRIELTIWGTMKTASGRMYIDAHWIYYV